MERLVTLADFLSLQVGARPSCISPLLRNLSPNLDYNLYRARFYTNIMPGSNSSDEFNDDVEFLPLISLSDSTLFPCL
ncbi:hypothetical protein BDV32DRAFT_119590 [Aspergillus pseudonomiae]|nr:hypothetical protein BDV32DRAFT_119590 [Aspergillus pseudonomiae]